MDDSLSNVYTGVWRDKTRGALGFGVWTVGDVLFVLVNLTIGIAFGLVQQSLERLIIHLSAYVSYKCNCCPKVRQDDNETARSIAGTPDESPTRCGRRGAQKKNRGCSSCISKTWSARLLTVIPIVLGVWWSVAGSFATKVPTDQVATSASKTCDLYGLPVWDQNPARQESDALRQGQKEARAGQYSRGCYQSQLTTGLSQCGLFKNQKLPVIKKERQECPFKNQTYCEADGLTAVKFTTPRVKAADIGIMTSKAHTFQRTMMCVPLNLEDPPRGPGFVEKTRPETGYWRYDLGGRSSDEYSSDYTYVQNGDPFKTNVPAYTLSTYQHVYSDGSDNYWQPSRRLDLRDDIIPSSKPYSLTIIFVSSCRLLYKQSSDDPIFPATHAYSDTNLYYNWDSRARPLACIDWIDTFPNDQKKPLPHYRRSDPRLHDPSLPHNKRNLQQTYLGRFQVSNVHDGSNSTYDDTETAFEDDKSYVFMRLALEKSTAFNAIQFRGATSLDAQSKIQDFISLPLHDDPTQWIVEAQGFFETSLARVQYNALDIAFGAERTVDTYKILTPSMWAKDALCGMFLLQLPKGYHNTNIWVQGLLLLTLLVLGLMGLEMKQGFSEDEKYSPWFDDLKLLRIEWLCMKLGCCGSRKANKSPSRPGHMEPQSPRSSTHSSQRNYNTFGGGEQTNEGTSNTAPAQPSSSHEDAAAAGAVASTTSTEAAEQTGPSTSSPTPAKEAPTPAPNAPTQANESRTSTDLANPDNYVREGASSVSNKATLIPAPDAQVKAQSESSSSEARAPSSTKATTIRPRPARARP